MKQIKTICTRMNNADEFDRKVNTAIKDGWTLIKRETILPLSQPHDSETFIHIMLYAELEKDTTEESEIDPRVPLIRNPLEETERAFLDRVLKRLCENKLTPNAARKSLGFEETTP